LVKKFTASMESEGSQPCSQKPTNGTYPQPTESNLHTSYLSKILMLSITYVFLV